MSYLKDTVTKVQGFEDEEEEDPELKEPEKPKKELTAEEKEQES